MDYEQTLRFLFSRLPAYHRIGKAAYRNDLLVTLSLDEYFNSPHKYFKTIHIAGTNGKGSVSHMVASVLQEAGYKTGLFTSPHLKDFRERIKVNGIMISKNSVRFFVQKHRAVIERLKPSFFEMTSALALEHFAAEKVDIAVIETGMGGRLDSTNIITPVLSVITNIGHDHMDLLGDTFEKIAAEKAGIIKPGVPVVISETQPQSRDVFISCAKEKNAEITFADQCYSSELKDIDNRTGKRHYVVTSIKSGEVTEGVIPLGGDYQAKNIQAVFTVYDVIRSGLKVTRKDILNGIRKVVENTGISGRWQIIGEKPLTICDTGHNREGLEYVMDQISRIKRTKLHMVIGFVNDKDLDLVLPLFPADADYYYTRAAVPRALDENVLMKKAGEYGLSGKSYANVKTALKAARSAASDSDLIFVGGSTFVVAEIV